MYICKQNVSKSSRMRMSDSANIGLERFMFLSMSAQLWNLGC